MSRVAELPAPKLLDRIETIHAVNERPNKAEAAALLGRVEEPLITVRRALDLYWDLARDKTFGKSRDQIRRWRNPRIKAIGNFVGVVGNRPLAELDRDDVLAFRDWWLGRVEAGEVTASSANKDITHLASVLRTVIKMRRLDVSIDFGDLMLRENAARQRPAFSREWIETRILADGALRGLNGEARAIVLGMVNTGYRPSEGAGLTADTIRLDDNVPHIRIEPGERELKTQHSRRTIPLLGVSLEALRDHRGGFPRYRDKPGLSATINKFLRANGLMETAEHTLYGLRHSFEDRMLAANIDERIRRDLMGHTLTRERYGAGASLAHMAELLVPVAL